MDEEYDFMKHVRQVGQWFTELKQENELEVFFGAPYLDKHRFLVGNPLRHFHKTKNIGVQYDKETIAHMLTMPSDTLYPLLYNWSSAPLFEHAKAGMDLLIVNYVIRQDEKQPKSLRWSVVLPATAVNPPLRSDKVVVTGLTPQVQDMATIQRMIEKYKTVEEKTKQDMEDFIERSFIGQFDCAYRVEERKASILYWLGTSFRQTHVLFTFDYTEPHLYRQLFTNKLLMPDRILNTVTNHPTFNMRINISYLFRKVSVTISCQEMLSKSPLLFGELSSLDKDLFTDLEDYRVIAAKRGEVLVDVVQIRQGVTLKSVTVLEKASYASMLMILAAREKFNNGLLDIDDDQRIITHQAKQRMLSLCETKVASILNDQVTEWPGGCSSQEGMNPFLSNRMHVMTKDPQYGLDDSCRVIRGCVTRTFDKANKLIVKKGVDAFNGDMELTRRTIALSDINEHSFPTHMKDQETGLLINDHVVSGARINTLNLMIGTDWLSQCIVPSVANHHHYYADNMLVNNGTIIINNHNNNNYIARDEVDERNDDEEEQEEERPKKKRKRRTAIVKESSKKFKLVKEEDMHMEVERHDGTIIIPLTSTKLINPDWDESRKCRMCDKTRPLKSFCATQEQKGVTYNYLKSVCNSCRLRWDKTHK